MAAPRRFDHDEARRLYRSGKVSKGWLAQKFGVSFAAIDRVVNPARANQMAARNALAQRSICATCGAPCSFNRYRRDVPRCLACWNKEQTTSVREDALWCSTCQEWKWDTAFPWDQRRPGRRGRHEQCTECGTKARRAYRERCKVTCARCGKPRLPAGEKNGKYRGHRDTGLCQDCYRSRGKG